MATIYLSLSTKADSNPQKEIRIRFKHGKIDQQAKTGVFIPAEYWDEQNQSVVIPNFRLMTAEKKELVSYLTNQSENLNGLTTAIQTIFTKVDKSAIESDWLKLVIDKFNFPDKYEPKVDERKSSLFKFIESFIVDAPNRKDKNTGRPLTRNNIQQYKATEKHLKIFSQRIGKSDFDFTEVNQEFYDNFVEYLQSEIQATDENGKPMFDTDGNPIMDKESFTQNSVGKHIRILKLMLNEATIQGFNENPYYNSFHVFTEETDTIYLNETELQKVKDIDLSKKPHLDRVRDWFLLLAWTGCRFSDLSKIVKTDIKDGFITFRQQKTNNKVTIPLHPVVQEILEKYNYDLPEEISNQKFNAYIKDVAKLAKINDKETLTRTVGGKLITEKFEKWEQVSSHTGRRSFCTNMYKRGLPTLMIMSISGHKTEKSFLKYIKIKQSEHAEMMQKRWAEMYKS